MAKRIVDEEMKFTVIINGDKAQQELYALEQSTKKYTQENFELRKERALLQKQGKRGTAEYKRLSATIKENSAVIEKNKIKMTALRSEIGVTGLSMEQLRKQAAILKIQLGSMNPNHVQYKKLSGDLKKITARMAQLRVQSQSTESSLSRLANSFNKYQALVLGFAAAVAGVVVVMQGYLDYSGKLSDAQSDVQKTTGLTKESVDELTKSFGALKTRTARIELLELATEAGRLGIEGVENIKGFVEQANKMKVALGDDLSTVQIREVGKITKIYRVGEQTGRDFAASLDAVGSAINAVSASGENQAGYLVNYLSRQAGVAKQAKISAADNIGFAATFDEIGQKVEVASTAMNKVYIDLFKNPGEYAKVAGLEIAEFTDLLGTDANEAMLLFLEGLENNSEGFKDMLGNIEGLNVGGTRGEAAILALAASTGKLREKQEIANRELIKATSLTDEYNLKNNNLAATLAKVQRRMIGMFTSQGVIKGLTNFVQFFAKFIGASEDADGRVARFKNRLVAFLKALIVVGSAILSNVVYLKLIAFWTATSAQATWLYTVAMRANAIATEIAFAATQLYAAVTMLLTGNIKGATQAVRVLSATMKTTPWGLVLGLVTAVVVSYIAFSDQADKAAASQRFLNDAQKSAQKSTAGQAAHLETLLKIARDVTASDEARLAAVKALNKAVPEYNNNLTVETSLTEDADVVLNKYIDSLERQAEAQFFVELVKKKAKEVIEAENSSLEDNIAWYEQLWGVVKAGGSVVGGMANSYETAAKNKIGFVEASKEELRIAKEMLAVRLKENPDLISGGTSTDGGGGGTPKEGDTKYVEGVLYTYTGGKWVKSSKGGSKAQRDVSGELAIATRQLLKATREKEDARIALIEDSYLREAAIIRTAHTRKLQDLESQRISEEEINKIDADIDSALVKGKAKEAIALEAIKTAWIEKNEMLNRQIEHENSLSVYRDGEMAIKGSQEQMDQMEADFKRKQDAAKIAHLQELVLLGDDQAAKKALKEKFHQEDLARQKEHLEELMRQMSEIIAQGDFGGIDLTLLTDEQAEAMLEMLDEIKKKLAEVAAAAGDVTGGGGDTEGGDIFAGLGGERDLLGFSLSDWETLYDNLDTTEGKLAAGAAAILAFTNAWGQYNKFVAANENARVRSFEEAERKKQEVLRKRLDTGMINQRQYDAAVDASNKQLEQKKAEIAYKQAKRAKAQAIAETIMNTAIAIMQGYAQLGPIGGTIAGVIMTAMGALQVGMIAKQPLPSKGYQDGYGYGNIPVRREQDGKVFNAVNGGESRSGLVDTPTVFLAGEQGKNFPELIISGPDLKRISPEVTSSLRNELAAIKGFQGGYDANPSQGSRSTDNSSNELLYSLLIKNTQVLESISENGVQAWMAEDIENFKKVKDGLARYDKIKQKTIV